MAKTATDRVVEQCGTWKSRAQLVRELPDIGGIDSLVNNSYKNGRLHRRGKPGAYEYRADPEWKPKPRGGARPNSGRREHLAEPPQQETAATTLEPAPTFGASLGLVVAKLAAPARRQREDTSETWELARGSIERLLKHGGMTIDDLFGDLDLALARCELAALLHGAVEAGHLGVRFSRSQRANVYFLPDPPEDQDDGAGPLPPLPDSAYPADGVPAPVRPAPDGRARILGPAGLRDRMTAIAGDIADVLDDACDAELPHRLIKNLLAANAGIARALRSTES